MQSPIACNSTSGSNSILFQVCHKQAQTVFLKFQFSMGIAVKRYNFLKVVNLHTYIYIDITYIFIHLHVCIFPELWSVVQEEPIKMPGSHNILFFKLSQKYNHFSGNLAFSCWHTFHTYFMFISFYNFFEKLTHSKR